MAKIICHNKGRYNIFETITSNFYFEKSLSLDELKEHIKDSDGEEGLEILPSRLKRAHKNGNSEISRKPLEDFLCCNRAGENETTLTTQECVDKFLS